MEIRNYYLVLEALTDIESRRFHFFSSIEPRFILFFCMEHTTLVGSGCVILYASVPKVIKCMLLHYAQLMSLVIGRG